MLSRSQRLHLEEFNRVMEKGRVHHSSLFLMRTLKAGTQAKISAVASKKVAKTAAQRNYVRRKTYEAVRTFYSSMMPGTSTILFAKPAVTSSTVKDIASDLRNLFVKAGLLR